MTIAFEYRILEEKSRGQKTALDLNKAVDLVCDHVGLPASGVLQVKDLSTGEMRTIKIKGGKPIK